MTTGGAMAMTALRATHRAAGGRGFALAPWCLPVFALVILHLALMTGEHHSGIAASPHAGTLAVSGVPANFTMLVANSDSEHSDHDTPRNTLDGCPVGQAILPLILLLLGIIGTYFVRPIFSATAASATRRAPPAAPPPLPAAQRRAFLQTFII